MWARTCPGTPVISQDCCWSYSCALTCSGAAAEPAACTQLLSCPVGKSRSVALGLGGLAGAAAPAAAPETMCCLPSTVLEEEKLQHEERLRMESRRQVAVSWDSGGSDEAPPKVAEAPPGGHPSPWGLWAERLPLGSCAPPAGTLRALFPGLHDSCGLL